MCEWEFYLLFLASINIKQSETNFLNCTKSFTQELFHNSMLLYVVFKLHKCVFFESLCWDIESFWVMDSSKVHSSVETGCMRESPQKGVKKWWSWTHFPMWRTMVPLELARFPSFWVTVLWATEKKTMYPIGHVERIVLVHKILAGLRGLSSWVIP